MITSTKQSESVGQTNKNNCKVSELSKRSNKIAQIQDIAESFIVEMLT